MYCLKGHKRYQKFKMNVIILSESSEKLFEISLTPCSRYVNLKNELFCEPDT